MSREETISGQKAALKMGSLLDNERRFTGGNETLGSSESIEMALSVVKKIFVIMLELTFY